MMGSEFHTFGPNDEKALIPQVFSEKRGTTSRDESAERRSLCGAYAEISSLRYDGILLLFKHWWQSDAILKFLLSLGASAASVEGQFPSLVLTCA